VQLFDSWAGALSPADYERYVLPHSGEGARRPADLGVPRIHFGVGTGELLGLMADAGADVVGVDWRVPLDDARDRGCPAGVALQGNLDPAVCLAPGSGGAEGARRAAPQRRPPGHVFNLGHGVLPETDPEILERVVELVHTDAAEPDPP
jgi:uroporphyrinogen decarboxylase